MQTVHANGNNMYTQKNYDANIIRDAIHPSSFPSQDQVTLILSHKKNGVVDPEWFIPDPAKNFGVADTDWDPDLEQTWKLLLPLHYYSPESSGRKIGNKILIYLLFHSCWIRIQEKVPDPTGSGSTALKKNHVGHVTKHCGTGAGTVQCAVL